MNTTQTTFQTLFRSLKISAAVATAFVALAQPQIALAGEAGMSANVVAAERFRAADNGSADVKIAGVATARTVVADTDAKSTDLQTVGRTADRKVFDGGGYTADRKVFDGGGYTADRKVFDGGGRTADRKVFDGGGRTADRKVFDGGG
ncbi:MAG: hypothetical protein H7346_26325, partial [Burkholderiaceae bacterium]|nr:hypothetical protein [Burkholderiaceae bacterium]